VKYLVETMGDYGLLDVFGGQEVAPFRPSVVRPTSFIEAQKGSKLKVLELLSDEADDETLARATNLEEAIAALPRLDAEKPTAKRDPLDHDGDGRKGGGPAPRRKT
jgi:hypothetical protein